jgi:hypothetical protein
MKLHEEFKLYEHLWEDTVTKSGIDEKELDACLNRVNTAAHGAKIEVDDHMCWYPVALTKEELKKALKLGNLAIYINPNKVCTIPAQIVESASIQYEWWPGKEAEVSLYLLGANAHTGESTHEYCNDLPIVGFSNKHKKQFTDVNDFHEYFSKVIIPEAHKLTKEILTKAWAESGFYDFEGITDYLNLNENNMQPRTAPIRKRRTQITESTNHCYVCNKPCEDNNAQKTIVGYVHNDCWDDFMETDEWYADAYYEYATGEADIYTEDTVNTFGADNCMRAWNTLRDAGKLPFSNTECHEIERKFDTRQQKYGNTVDVYITYDRYEHNEFFAILHIDKNMQSAIKHYEQEDLFKFLSFGPDDCHTFQLQKVNMTPKEYNRFINLVKKYGTEEIDDGPLYDIMVDIYERIRTVADEREYVLDASDCDEIEDVVEFYCKKQGLDYNDDDTRYDAEDELFGDSDVFEKWLKEYLADKYSK